MSKTIEISRELAERLTRPYPAEITDQATIYTIRIEALAALDELRALLAAPAVERQEPVAYVLARQTAVEVPGKERKELGYTLFDGIGVFHSREEVHAAIAELGLPLGWVSMTVEQLLPGWMMPADTSPPAPVAVVLPERQDVDDLWHSVMKDRAIGWNACLDKVKEMNE